MPGLLVRIRGMGRLGWLLGWLGTWLYGTGWSLSAETDKIAVLLVRMLGSWEIIIITWYGRDEVFAFEQAAHVKAGEAAFRSALNDGGIGGDAV